MPHLTHICKNSISTTQFSKIVFLPIPAELELGGTGWGEFLKIQSKLERPLIIEQGISLSFFCTFFVAGTHLSLLYQLLFLWDILTDRLEGMSFIPAF